nr:MAG TPA: hypothetical protein [Caudoviricetes sp.]
MIKSNSKFHTFFTPLFLHYPQLSWTSIFCSHKK